MNKVIRTEKKFILNLDTALRERRFLAELLHADEHNGEDGYLVRTLYFDTVSDDDYYDKLDGIYHRRGLRLRTYGEYGGSALFEIKEKFGSVHFKRSLLVSPADAEEFMRGEYGALTMYRDELAHELHALLTANGYVPKVTVQYSRFALTAPEFNTRITFDSLIKATQSKLNIFSRDAYYDFILPPDKVILEVKYSDVLPEYIKRLVSTIGRQETAVSKYMLARRNL